MPQLLLNIYPKEWLFYSISVNLLTIERIKEHSIFIPNPNVPLWQLLLIVRVYNNYLKYKWPSPIPWILVQELHINCISHNFPYVDIETNCGITASFSSYFMTTFLFPLIASLLQTSPNAKILQSQTLVNWCYFWIKPNLMIFKNIYIPRSLYYCRHIYRCPPNINLFF